MRIVLGSLIFVRRSIYALVTLQDRAAVVPFRLVDRLSLLNRDRAVHSWLRYGALESPVVSLTLARSLTGQMRSNPRVANEQAAVERIVYVPPLRPGYDFASAISRNKSDRGRHVGHGPDRRPSQCKACATNGRKTALEQTAFSRVRSATTDTADRRLPACLRGRARSSCYADLPWGDPARCRNGRRQ